MKDGREIEKKGSGRGVKEKQKGGRRQEKQRSRRETGDRIGVKEKQ